MDISWIDHLAVCALIVIVAFNVTEINRKTKGEWSILILIPLVSFTFIFVCIPLLMSLPFLWLYREITRFYLKIKHGSNFTGLIEGADVLNMCNKTENSLVTILLMFERTDDHNPHDVYETFKDVLDKYLMQNREKLAKYCSVLHESLGYFYTLKQNVTIDDCVKKMKTLNNKNNEITKEELLTIISETSNDPLPLDNRILWDIHVGIEPVDWISGEKTSTKYYPAVCRVHHAISDGFDFVQLLAGFIADKSNENSKEEYMAKLNEDSLHVVILHHVILFLYAFIYAPSQFILENLLLKKERSILSCSKLSNSDVIAIKIDDGKYLRKIKDMKSRLPGTSFSDVLLTAFSASISEYFEKHSTDQPEHLKFVVPFLRKALLLPKMPVGQLTLNDLSCHNSFTMVTLNFPLCLENNNIVNANSPLIQRLKLIKMETRRSINSVDNKLMYFWSHMGLQLFPFIILKKMYDMLEWTAVLSVLPGPPPMILANGKLPIYDIVFWIPHVANIGCNFSILTYNSRLQFGLNIDRTIISNEESAQSILDGILKYLDLLEEEIKNQT